MHRYILQFQLEFEKTQRRKVEKDLKKLTTSYEEEKKISQKHKEVALVLIREKKDLFEKLLLFQERNSFLEKQIQNSMENKDKSVNEYLAHEKAKIALKMEAAMEKQLSDFDIEREQLSGKLRQELERNIGLEEQLKNIIKESHLGKNIGVTIAQPLLWQTSSTQTSLSFPGIDHKMMVIAAESQSAINFKCTKQMADISEVSDDARRGSNITDSTATATCLPVRNLSQDSSGAGRSLFCSPTGTRISLNIGTENLSTRKVQSVGRGTPPPIPPNKPQITIPLIHRKEGVATCGEFHNKYDNTADTRVASKTVKKERSSKSYDALNTLQTGQNPDKSFQNVTSINNVPSFKKET